MTDDIVTRLRTPIAGNYDDENFSAGPQPCAGCCEAADEIERLRTECDALRNEVVQRIFNAAGEIELLRKDRDRWRHWASEYLYTDPDCECPLCDEVREAYDKTV